MNESPLQYDPDNIAPKSRWLAREFSDAGEADQASYEGLIARGLLAVAEDGQLIPTQEGMKEWDIVSIM